MFINNDIYISPRFSRRNYVDLGLNSESAPDIWQNAVQIFEDRIKGRYLDPIYKLIDEDPNRNGFSAMALMCLLVDTFMQFRFGLPQSENRKSKWNYIVFMNKYLNIREDISSKFYSDIRSGILHSAETRNGSYLIPDDYITIEPLRIERKTILKVSVRGMFRDIVQYFQNYCNELMDANNVECRRNFITKMDDITLKYDVLNGDFELWAVIVDNANNIFHDFKRVPFSYSISEFDQAIIINSRGSRFDIKIPFSDIKQSLYYTNPKARHYIVNSWYIDSILKEFPEAVERYIRNNAA